MSRRPRSSEPIDINEVFSITLSDVEKAETLIADFDAPNHRRNYIRAVFAAIEGATYVLKYNVLVDADETFTAAELSMLVEDSFRINSRGQIETSQKFIPIASNIRFAFGMQAKNALASVPVDYGNHGWQSLRNAIRIRNRLTHPKRPSDLVVSDMDLDEVRSVYKWFVHSVIGLLYLVNESLRKKVEELDSRVERGSDLPGAE